MDRELVVRWIDGDGLDCLRTCLTRGDPRIALVDPDRSFSKHDIEEFLARLNCDEYTVEDRAPDDFDVDQALSPANNYFLLSSNGDPGPRARPGIANDVFRDDHGPTTDFNLRLVNLGCLRVQGRMTVWEVGAGTGSVSIESARLNPSARYYAIESDPGRLKTLERNIRSTGTYNVRPVEGMAPAVFDDLPAPDRVFIGGTRGQLDDILTSVHEVLTKNGIVVANFLRMKFVHDAHSFFMDRGYEVELIQVATHESRTVEPQHIEWQEGPAFPVLIARKRATDG